MSATSTVEFRSVLANKKFAGFMIKQPSPYMVAVRKSAEWFAKQQTFPGYPVVAWRAAESRVKSQISPVQHVLPSLKATSLLTGRLKVTNAAPRLVQATVASVMPTGAIARIAAGAIMSNLVTPPGGVGRSIKGPSLMADLMRPSASVPSAMMATRIIGTSSTAISLLNAPSPFMGLAWTLFRPGLAFMPRLPLSTFAGVGHQNWLSAIGASSGTWASMKRATEFVAGFGVSQERFLGLASATQEMARLVAAEQARIRAMPLEHDDADLIETVSSDPTLASYLRIGAQEIADGMIGLAKKGASDPELLVYTTLCITAVIVHVTPMVSEDAQAILVRIVVLLVGSGLLKRLKK